MPFIENQDNYRLLHIGERSRSKIIEDTENRFTDPWLGQMENLLTEIENDITAGQSFGLIITASGKFFSNGLSIENLQAADSSQAYIDRVNSLFARILVLGVPTISAVNGHAFGAGAMLPLCTDTAIMRTERGFICYPEASLKMPFPHGMSELIKHSLSPAIAREAMLTARRYTSAAALSAGIIQEEVPEEQLIHRAKSRLETSIGFSGRNYHSIKAGLYSEIISALHIPSQPLRIGD